MELELLLQRARELGASDLHLSAGRAPWFRVDGDLGPQDNVLLKAEVLLNWLRAIMPESLKTAFAAGQDLDFSLERSGLGRCRVHAYAERGGLAVALRLLPMELPRLENLGVPVALSLLLDRPHGLVLVCGATGAGKSTTLAALLDRLNQTRRGHILTVEDPIEFVHASRQCLVHQREIGRDAPDFESALRSALREDPNYLLIGELRDLETMRQALRAAEGGHLVLATLHAGSAARAVQRFVGVFPAAEQNFARSVLAEALQAVLAQRLLPQLGGGRVAIYELMLATPAVRHLIREDKSTQLEAAIQLGAAQGMQSMQQHLELLQREGKLALSN